MVNGKVVNTLDDLDDLDLELELSNSENTIEESNEINESDNNGNDDDELVLDDELLLDDEPSTALDELSDSMDLSAESESIDNLVLEDKKCNTPEDTLKPDLKHPLDLLDDELNLDLELDVNNGLKNNKKETKNIEIEKETTKRKRKTKSEKEFKELNDPTNSEITKPVIMKEDKVNHVVTSDTRSNLAIVEDFDLTKINDRKYRFLAKHTGIPNEEMVIDSSIESYGKNPIPLHVAYQDGEYILIDSFNTFDSLIRLNYSTAITIIHYNMSDYDIVKRLMSKHHRMD